MSVRTSRFHGPGEGRSRRRRRDRGAVAVEYALGISLVVVALIGSIEALSDGSADKLDERGSSIGAPDLDATGDPAPPPLPPADPTDPDPDPAPESIVSVALTGEPDRQGQVWSASVTVRALDDVLRPRESVLVEAQWGSASPAFGAPRPTQCTTNLNGTCTMTIRNLQRSAILDVNLTVLSISGQGVVPAPLPGVIVCTQSGCV